MAETRVMIDNSTRAMNMEDKDRLFLQSNIRFKEMYEIYSNQLIGIGGESLVYKAKRLSDGEEVAAKIHDQFNPKDRVKEGYKTNRKVVIDFLLKSKNYKETHIMPLYDYDDGFEVNINGVNCNSPIEIMPYCTEKSFNGKEIKYFDLKNIIHGILKALNNLHSSSLVHRDLKPDNLFILNGVVVLGDFGTASKIEKTDINAGFTKTRRGTYGYSAPEVWGGYFNEAADYYSLGCTIATLYKGEHVYQRALDRANKKGEDGELNLNMSKGLNLNCSDEEADLQELVNSLIIHEAKDRAGYDDVFDWLNNINKFKEKWQPILKKEYSKVSTGFKFKDRICNSKTELTEAMLNDWEYAKQVLYKGGEKNSAIVNYFSKEESNLSLKAIEIIEENRSTVNNQDLGLAMFLHYINTINDKPCPIYWIGKTYNNIEEISTAIKYGDANKNNIIKMLENKFLSWKFYNTKGIKQDTIIAIMEIEDITALEKCKQIGYYTFMYKFSAKEEILNTTADKIFKELTWNKGDWHKTAEKSINNDKILANLINLGWKSNVLGFKKGCTGKLISEDSISDLLLFYQLFEGVCEDKNYVRKHYLQYGPQANIFKELKNLDMNIFVSKIVKDKINNLKINLDISISDLYNSFMLFKGYLKDEEREKERIEKEKRQEEQRRKIEQEERLERERRQLQERKEKEEIERQNKEYQERLNREQNERKIKKRNRNILGIVLGFFSGAICGIVLISLHNISTGNVIFIFAIIGSILGGILDYKINRNGDMVGGFYVIRGGIVGFIIGAIVGALFGAIFNFLGFFATGIFIIIGIIVGKIISTREENN